MTPSFVQSSDIHPFGVIRDSVVIRDSFLIHFKNNFDHHFFAASLDFERDDGHDVVCEKSRIHLWLAFPTEKFDDENPWHVFHLAIITEIKRKIRIDFSW